MGALVKSITLFLLNWLDAQLTLFWVHTNIAAEGNGLLAPLLRLGDAPFMLTKIAVGTFAAYVLYRNIWPTPYKALPYVLGGWLLVGLVLTTLPGFLSRAREGLIARTGHPAQFEAST